MSKNEKIQISVYLEPELLEKVVNYASDNIMKPNAVIEKALEEFNNNKEGKHHEKI